MTREEKREYDRTYRINNRDRLKENRLRNYWKNPDKAREYTKQWQRSLKDEVFEAYGGYACRCCGETTKEFLSIDHINNDGCEERKNTKRAGNATYMSIKQNGFPKSYQILCMNCNFGRSRTADKICPHQKVES